MVNFKAEIQKFGLKGEKTGWRYVFISSAVANEIKPNEKRSFRVKGEIDEVAINGIALMPMGEGDFILVLKTSLRKLLKKEVGAIVSLKLTFDEDFKIAIPEDLEFCLADETPFLKQFLGMPESHRNYFINWLNSAKTESTRTKRLIMIVGAMAKGFDYSQMIRASQGKPIDRTA